MQDPLTCMRYLIANERFPSALCISFVLKPVRPDRGTGMKMGKFSATIATITIISGCSIFEKDHQTIAPDNGRTKLGLNVEELELSSEIKNFSTPPRKNYYYGQLYITVHLYDEAVLGARSRNFSDYIFTTYGKETKQFSVAISPQLNGVNLPEVPLFSYKYESEKGEWSSSIRPRYSSPIFPLGDDSRIGFNFKFISSDSFNLNINKLVSDAVSLAGVLNPGVWVISAASQKVVGDATEGVSKTISNAITIKQEANIADQMEPVIDGVKQRIYIIKDNDNKDIAKITFSTRLFTSLVSGDLVKDDSAPADFKAAVPTLNPYINPLNKIKITGGNSKTLNSELTGKSELTLEGVSDPVVFKIKCRKIIDELQGQYGLTVFDSLNSMRHLLMSTEFTRDKILFESNCLNLSEKKLLEEMKVPITYEGRSTSVTLINDESLRKLSAYMKSPEGSSGYAADVLNIFVPDSYILVVSIPGKFSSLPDGTAYYYRQDLLRELGKIGVAKSWWQRPSAENEISSSGTVMYFRPLDKKEIFALELNQYDKIGPVNNIIVRAVSDDEISMSLKNRLMEPAIPLIPGASTDVVLSSD